MLSCREISKQADAFLDKELPFRKRMQVRLHLLMCRGCNRFVDQMRMTRRLIATEAKSKVPRNSDDTTDIDSILVEFDELKQPSGHDDPAAHKKDQ